MKTNAFSNQLRWVILLLAAAVILPTVCLVWFMTQAVKNEQLAVRSKLSSAYRSEIDRVFGPFMVWLDTQSRKAHTVLSEQSPYEAYATLAAAAFEFDCGGLFLQDAADGRLLYPATWTDADAAQPPAELAEAVRLEFSAHNPGAALAVYRQILDTYDAYERTGQLGGLDPVLYKRCKLAEARLVAQQGYLDTAIELCECVQREPREDAANWYFYTAANLNILDLLEAQGLDDSARARRFNERVRNLLYVLRNNRYLSTDQRLMAYGKIRSFDERYRSLLSYSNRRELADLENRMNLERRSLDLLYQYGHLVTEPVRASVEKFPDTRLYVFTLNTGPVRAIRVMDAESIVRELSEQLVFSDDIHWRIENSDGQYVSGMREGSHTPFLTLPIGGGLDLRAVFYEADTAVNVFETAAKRQTTIYIWTGVLVIGLILGSGSLAIRSVSHQIKMNRLKNDFIATVTHELKTPLASMRLLVDTLLEKRYNRQQTANEYLQMISQENKRLTHLIDSFLTFSRMERNKQVFDFQPVPPKTIATEAAEAMQAKLGGPDCRFTTAVEEDLPPVYADKDGMVTVLVNLLDNARKYTNGQKDIELSVYALDGTVCFAVRDKGIGLNPRIRKKIFNRFYQADSRLSRRTEGCGLGLSIVKFIVDAHKGQIDVQSRPNQGSTFVVKLAGYKG